MQTTAAIGANQELLTEYGAHYWEQIKQSEKILKDVAAALTEKDAEKDAALAACAEKDAKIRELEIAMASATKGDN